MPPIPIPSALNYLGVFFLIFGFFLLIAGSGVIKVEKISVKPGCATLAFGAFLIIVGFAFLFPEIKSKVSAPTLTPTSTVTDTPVPISSPESSLPASEQVYSNSSVLHLGDEDSTGWEPLIASCFKMSFVIKRPVNGLMISLQVFDTDAENPVFLNNVQVSLLPAQNEAYAESWSDTIKLPISNTYIQQGTNDLMICSAPALNPDFVGDIDDFQIRDITITTE
jgi:hypothetical protein